MNREKQWWAPVWKGLVMDQNAIHCRNMKSSVWLFLYILLSADRITGSMKKKMKTISLDMGIKERTVRAWLRILKQAGYLEIKNSGHCLSITVKKWKSLSHLPDSARQSDKTTSVRVAEFCKSESSLKGQKSACLSQKTPVVPLPNDISITRAILTNDIDGNNYSLSNGYVTKRFNPQTREELLALDLATSLDDIKGIALYLSYSRKYPEHLLRRIMSEVRAIPDNKIKKGRGALFNHLVKQYAKQNL